MKIINLLPKEELRELKLESASNQILSFWFSVLLTLVFIFALGLIGSVYLTQKISMNKAQIEEKKQSLSSASSKQVESQVITLNSQIKLIDSLRNDHYYWSKVLIELDNLVDSGTHISTIQMDRETGKIVLMGTADDRDSIMAFWNSVQKSKLFKNIDFPLTNLEKDQDASFTFTFYVNPEEIKHE